MAKIESLSDIEETTLHWSESGTINDVFDKDGDGDIEKVVDTNEPKGKPYCGLVAMRANCGWLLLCNVSQNMKTGEIVRVPIQVSEIHQIIMPTW